MLCPGILAGKPGNVYPTIENLPTGQDSSWHRDRKLLQLLSDIKPDTKVEIRDQAILLILFTYGVRGGHVRGLRLEDIDWGTNRICFKAMKRGREIVEPLTAEVANSLLLYLQEARPQVQYSEVFMTARAPYRPLMRSSTLSQIVLRHFEKSGIESPFRGSHVFRHTFATNMLKHSQSLKTIADMLGHRSMESTFHYTKVDFQALNGVALEWVEVEP